MAKAIKPTKQQLAQAKLRAAASGIKMDQSAKGLRNAGKAIAVGASLLPIGRGAKAASMVAKRAALVAKNKKSAKNNMKIVNAVADLQQKTKAETIASNSVKVKPADNILRLRKNVDSYYKTVKAKSGATAKEDAKKVASKKPAKVIKIKSDKRPTYARCVVGTSGRYLKGISFYVLRGLSKASSRQLH